MLTYAEGLALIRCIERARDASYPRTNETPEAYEARYDALHAAVQRETDGCLPPPECYHHDYDWDAPSGTLCSRCGADPAYAAQWLEPRHIDWFVALRA